LLPDTGGDCGADRYVGTPAMVMLSPLGAPLCATVVKQWSVKGPASVDDMYIDEENWMRTNTRTRSSFILRIDAEMEVQTWSNNTSVLPLYHRIHRPLCCALLLTASVY
jgi:hypothetical protein